MKAEGRKWLVFGWGLGVTLLVAVLLVSAKEAINRLDALEKHADSHAHPHEHEHPVSQRSRLPNTASPPPRPEPYIAKEPHPVSLDALIGDGHICTREAEWASHDTIRLFDSCGMDLLVTVPANRTPPNDVPHAEKWIEVETNEWEAVPAVPASEAK